MNRALPQETSVDNKIDEKFIEILTFAISVRTRTIPQTLSYIAGADRIIPRVAVLFSGGLDCSVIAWLIHTLLPPSDPIDLINVAFENPRSVAAQKTRPQDVYNICPDRITGRSGWEELRRLTSKMGRQWRFVEV